MTNFTLVDSNITQSDKWSTLSSAAQIIYVILRYHSDGNYKPTWVGIARLARLNGISINTASRGVQDLIDNGLIRVVTRGLKKIFYFIPWEGVKIKGKYIIHDSFIAIENYIIESGIWSRMSTSAKQVYLMFLIKSGQQKEFSLSNSKLAELIGISIATVKRAIINLSKMGIIMRKLKNGAKTIYSFGKKIVDKIQTNRGQKKPEPSSNEIKTEVKFACKQERTRKEQEEECISYTKDKKKSGNIVLDILNTLGIDLRGEKPPSDKDKLREEIVSIWRILHRLGIIHSENVELYNRLERIKSLETTKSIKEWCKIYPGTIKNLISHILDELEVD